MNQKKEKIPTDIVGSAVAQTSMRAGKPQAKLCLWSSVLATLAMGGGCAMCCGPYDYHYPTVPGKVERADPIYGRVGSIFSDPYTAGTGASADSNLRKTPLDPGSELQRLPSPQPDVDSPQAPVPDQGNVDRETRWQNRGQSPSRGKWR